MSKRLHICAFCGSEYITKVEESIYCSHKCHTNNQRSKMTPKVCKECGNQFRDHPGGHRVFCSEECYRKCEHRESIQDVTCTGCGKVFVAPISKRKKTEHPYCSRACYLRNFPDKETKFFHFVCEWCGDSYERTRSGMDPKSKHRFCSKKCNYAWVKSGNSASGEKHYNFNSTAIPCAACGKILYRPKGRIAKYKNQFCDKACEGVWNSGSNNRAWKGGRAGYRGPNWEQQAALARKRDGSRCQHCGVHEKKTGSILDIHHIKPFRDFGYVPNENDYYLQANDLSNLISLCRSCHMSAEWGKIPLQPMMIWQE